MKYAIRVEERLAKTFIIDDNRIDNVNDAIQIITDAINKGDIILTADDFDEREVSPADWTHSDGVVPVAMNVDFYEKFDTSKVYIPEQPKDQFPKRISYEEAKPRFRKCCICGDICDFTKDKISRMSVPKDIYQYDVVRDEDGTEYIQREIGGAWTVGMIFSKTPLEFHHIHPTNPSRRIMIISTTNFVWLDNAKQAVEFEDEEENK
ncbi:hypothetical protein [Bacteroides acidifaciens]|uniref:hypothetical protein n=1 Tax=Bacteroides acidifaciens TaxID=85831 RepID=UPI00263A9D7B|nr:hypothetical protein [Bacteroides acidifaciens]